MTVFVVDEADRNRTQLRTVPVPQGTVDNARLTQLWEAIQEATIEAPAE